MTLTRIGLPSTDSGRLGAANKVNPFDRRDKSRVGRSAEESIHRIEPSIARIHGELVHVQLNEPIRRLARDASAEPHGVGN